MAMKDSLTEAGTGERPHSGQASRVFVDDLEGPRPLGFEALDPEAWFISLRWIAILVALLMAATAVFVVDFLPERAWVPLISVIGTLAVLNLFYAGLRRNSPGSSVRLLWQAGVDLVLLTLLVHYSGGVENPLVLLMLFHVIIAGITLSRRLCYAIAAFATVLVTLMAAGEASGILEHYTLQLVPHYEIHGETAHVAFDTVYVAGYVGLQAIIFFLTAFFVTALSERLRNRERQLADSVDRARTQRQLLERSLETTETGLQVHDSNLDLILVNSRWKSWAARFGGDAELDPLFNGQHPLIRDTLESKAIKVLESTGSGRAGQAPTFQTTTAPLLDSAGQATHVVQLVRDVTWQKRAERRMIRAGQLAAVGELAGQVAHEVNNPIAIISAKARLLVSDYASELSDRTASELEKIIGLSDRVAQIASGLLSYARPSGAQHAPVDMTRPARDALSMIQQRAENSGILVEDGLPASLPAVYANERELEQVFLNLFLNALDAMSNRGALELTSNLVPLGTDGSILEIHVGDSGSGIPPDVLPRIFEPFFTTKPEGKGTGLGLSICQGIVQHNGGTIRVESSPEGTQFTLAFPLADPEAVDG